MTHKEVKASRLLSDDTNLSGSNGDSSLKRPRTQEDFYQFCSIILEYANYERIAQEEDTRPTARTPPPLDSSGSSINSESATSSSQEDKQSEDESDIEGIGDSSQDGDTNDDSYDSVTCYCHKPFAGRPMIECSRCLTWVHLSCARIRRTHIPEVFFCAMCKNEKTKIRGSSRNSDPISRPPGSRGSPPDSPKIKRIRKGH